MIRRFFPLILALLPSGVLVAAADVNDPKPSPDRSVNTQIRSGDGPTSALPASNPATRPTSRPTANTMQHFPAPPAPPLTPAQEMKTFTLPPGYHIELVASEPEVEDPVVAVFDADGRLWVAEMRAYMPDSYAHNEEAKIGRIVVLESTHNDGHFDKRTVFLDHIYLPRAILPLGDGALIGSPPYLWYCRATHGDLHCDQKMVISDKYGIAKDPEYGDNGLLWDRDNWIYNANSTVRYRYLGGDKFESAPTTQRGQWGLAQDDVGRLYYNYNSDQLRCDLIPTEYLIRNLHIKAAGGNVQIEKDQHVWSNRPNPGINRGYEPGNLRLDGHLNTVTATCGATIFRGTALGDDYGDAFIPEPAGNLVMHKKLIENDGMITVKTVLHEQDGKTLDFLCSTDERFRPVNTTTGPDGALYIVDMYRGLIQHRVYVTPYLRNQVYERKLEAPLHEGRIFRITRDGSRLTKMPKMSREPAPQLVEDLSNPNGWWRDTAQRLLIERRDEKVVPFLRKLAVSGRSPLARLGALWSLQGMDRLDASTLRTAMNDKDARVASAAIRLSEPMLLLKEGGLLADVLKQSARSDVRLQLVLSLSALPDEGAQKAVANALASAADKPFVKDAALSGMNGRELAFLQRLLADPLWQQDKNGRGPVLSALAACVFAEGKPQSVATLVEAITSKNAPEQQWQAHAMLGGLAAIAKAPGRKSKVALSAVPDALLKLQANEDKRTGADAKLVASLLTWPGKPDDTPKVARIELTAKQQESFERGKVLFGAICGQCHGPDGKGLEGKAPSLRDSPFALGPDIRVIRIVLNGAKGEFHVQGWTPNLEMPTLAVLSDDQIADVLTYVRHEWDHNAAAVNVRTVSRVRTEVGDRQSAWTEPELLAIRAPNRGARRNPATRPAL